MCKLLLDMRFLELKFENELLKGGCHVWHVAKICDENQSQIYPSKISAVERLALLCKAFMDTPFLELKRENERLKLELFWRTYSAKNLCIQLFKFHSTLNDVYCGCVSCKHHGRFESELDEEVTEWSCEYMPWFEDFLENNEMDFSHGRDDEDDNVHFNILDNIYGGWYWQYGRAFTEARSVGGTELQKLEGIFDTLGVMRDSILDV